MPPVAVSTVGEFLLFCEQADGKVIGVFCSERDVDGTMSSLILSVEKLVEPSVDLKFKSDGHRCICTLLASPKLFLGGLRS